MGARQSGRRRRAALAVVQARDPKFSDRDRTQDFLTKSGLSFASSTFPADSADTVVTKIGGTEIKGYNEAALKKALADLKYPAAADKNAINWPMTLLILWVMLIYVTMVYGPIAAYLVELFPTRIRYTSMSLPYHHLKQPNQGWRTASVTTPTSSSGSGQRFPEIGEEPKKKPRLSGRGQDRGRVPEARA